MMREITPVLIIPLKFWPEKDRVSWIANTAPGDPFDDEPRFANGLTDPTIEKTRKSYGRWLAFLQSMGWLDSEISPINRVTKSRLKKYLLDLKRCGNADGTIIGRFSDLERALKIISPGVDVSWVRRVNGRTVYSLLPKETCPLIVPSAKVLFDWGIDMMETSTRDYRGSYSDVAYRDGLLIAMLASRGRRVRSMCLLRIGAEIKYQSDFVVLDLKPAQVKTKVNDQIAFPEILLAYIAKYLKLIRPQLLKGNNSDAFWIGRTGVALTKGGMTNAVFRLTRRRFSKSFGPHRFRHAIVTSAAQKDPGTTGAAACLLGISGPVAEKHYNRARQLDVGKKFSNLIQRLTKSSVNSGA